MLRVSHEWVPRMRVTNRARMRHRWHPSRLSIWGESGARRCVSCRKRYYEWVTKKCHEWESRMSHHKTEYMRWIGCETVLFVTPVLRRRQAGKDVASHERVPRMRVTNESRIRHTWHTSRVTILGEWGQDSACRKRKNAANESRMRDTNESHEWESRMRVTNKTRITHFKTHYMRWMRHETLCLVNGPRMGRECVHKCTFICEWGKKSLYHTHINIMMWVSDVTHIISTSHIVSCHT